MLPINRKRLGFALDWIALASLASCDMQQFEAVQRNDSADFVHLSVVSTPWFTVSDALLALDIMCTAKDFSQAVRQISRILMTSVCAILPINCKRV
jgi:hypothetical protein